MAAVDNTAFFLFSTRPSNPSSFYGKVEEEVALFSDHFRRRRKRPLSNIGDPPFPQPKMGAEIKEEIPTTGEWTRNIRLFFPIDVSFPFFREKKSADIYFSVGKEGGDVLLAMPISSEGIKKEPLGLRFQLGGLEMGLDLLFPFLC